MEWISRLCALSLLTAIAELILPEGKLRKGALTVVGLVAVRMILGAALVIARQIT